MLNYENLTGKFEEVIHSKEWAELQSKFNQCGDVFLLGHGGNLGVADHAAVDITRLSNGQKNAMAPGSAIVNTSFINDTNWDDWMVAWLEARTRNRTPEQIANTFVLGISSSGKSVDIIKGLQHAESRGMQIACITSNPLIEKVQNLTEVVLGADYYHTAEVLTLLLTYELTHGSGNECPPIGKNSPEELELINRQKGAAKARKYAYPDELVNLAIDFDGVIHKNSKGYHDGTIYDEPIEGVAEALKQLSDEYTLIVYSAKARKDRGLINGKTGIQLIWEWLKKYDLDQYISQVTAEKPRAQAYIDDKAIAFTSWDSCFKELDNKKIYTKK